MPTRSRVSADLPKAGKSQYLQNKKSGYYLGRLFRGDAFLAWVKALRAMRSKLRPGGLLVISTRDFDRMLVERPATAPPLVVAGPPRRVVVRLHDWDAPDSPLYTVRFFVVTESGAGWTLAHHSTRYRAITSGTLSRAAEDAGFNESFARDEAREIELYSEVSFRRPSLDDLRSAGRNDPCPCGSGKKFKKCHGAT